MGEDQAKVPKRTPEDEVKWKKAVEEKKKENDALRSTRSEIRSRFINRDAAHWGR